MSVDDIADREIPHLVRLIEDGKSGWVTRLKRSRLALLVIAVLVFLFQIRNLPEKFAGQSLDAAIVTQQKYESTAVRLVVIDDKDYQDLFAATSPLSRDVLSKLLEAISEAGARAIVVDIDTSAASFATIKVLSAPTVWAEVGYEDKEGKFTVNPPLGGRQVQAGSVTALAVVLNDDRGIVRSYRRVYELKDGTLAESPGYVSARLLHPDRVRRASTGAGNERFLDFRYLFHPNYARDVLLDATYGSWKSISMFKDQIVVVGATYAAARDRYATPAGLVDGCEIVAQQVQAEIDETSIPSASRWLTGLLLVIGGLITVALYHWFSLRVAFFASLISTPILSVASNWILFHRVTAWGAMIPLVSAVILAELYAQASLYLDILKKISSVKSQGDSQTDASEDSEALAGPS